MARREGRKTYLLISNGIGRLAHQLLHVLDAAHLGVDLLEHLCTLLQSKQDVFLDESKLDAGGELLELLQLAVCLGEERFLVLLASEGEEGAFLVALGEHLFCYLGLAVGQDGYTLLVLVELVPLVLEVKNSPT